ncbi:hypothetical protein HN51_044402 [Arachis hypogaea]
MEMLDAEANKELDAGAKFGYIVLTTSAGIMDHEEARRKDAGGKVLGVRHRGSGLQPIASLTSH